MNPPYRLVRFSRVDFVRYANYLIEMNRAIKTIVKEAQDCDLMFVNGLSLASTIASKLTKKPMVVKIVGDGAWELAHTRGWTSLNLNDFQGFHTPRTDLFRAIRHAAAKRSQTIITPSHYLADIVKRWGISDQRIYVVYNAFVAPKTNPQTLPSIEIPTNFEQGLRLLTIGRLLPHKRIGNIIQVVAQMDNTRLIVIGDGPERGRLTDMAHQLKLSDRVLFTGRLPQNQVWYLLSHYAQILVLNSTYEGLPHVLLEAAHFGVPIVATDVGGTPEIITDQETGLLVPPDDNTALRRALQRLQYAPDLRDRLSKNAHQIFDQFSFIQMADRTEEILVENMQ
jgi:glycosyltransferase involved in cell wall biosynthesis